jgi:hypothetical protein
MTFQAKPFEQLPQAAPDVQIFFHGQLILRSDGRGCDVAVNPIATNHVLSIETRIKRQGEIDRMAMRHLGPLKFRNPEGMLLEVRENGATAAPAAFKLVTNDPFDPTDPDSTREDDFRWILNLEGQFFHNTPLNPRVFASQNVIRMLGGEFYFKTAARAHPRFQYRRSGGGNPQDLIIGAIGCVASASVFLGEDQSLRMRWQDGTREDDRTLSLEKSADTCYEIYVENTPLFLDPPRPADLPGLDEFIEYYKVLDLPAGLNRFSVVPELRLGPQAGTPEVPCQVITLDGQR